jgi:hypothetical protein
MTQPANPVIHGGSNRTLDPTPVPPERRGAEAPVADTHDVNDGSDIGGTKVRP